MQNFRVHVSMLLQAPHLAAASSSPRCCKLLTSPLQAPHLAVASSSPRRKRIKICGCFLTTKSHKGVQQNSLFIHRLTHRSPKSVNICR
jgi:hypothetical protein